MNRYFIELAYNGSHFAGWQIQHHKTTVQGELNNALSEIFDHKILTKGASRTDAGVHARQNFAHFDIKSEIPSELASRLNRMVGPDILIKRVFQVEPEQHARFDAGGRAYEYYIHLNKDPFLNDQSFGFVDPRFDFNKIKSVARIFEKYNEYKFFCRYVRKQTGTDCRIKVSRIEWIEPGLRFKYVIKADRFLHGMVRRIVGTLLMVGVGKLEVEELHDALMGKKQLRHNYAVPPNGLFLTAVDYNFSLPRQ